MLFTNEASTGSSINSPEVRSTKLNSPKSLDKLKILWKEESPDSLNSYGPLSVRPPVGATYISLPYTNEGSTCNQLWRFRALEFNSTDSVLKLPIPIEEAIILFFMFLTRRLFS